MNTYFITGATGCIGAALVPLLLKDAKNHLYLLIRARDREHLRQRFGELCAFWELDPAALGSRVSVLRGDVTMPHFGLSEPDYDNLAASCSHIIHSAGNVRMNMSLADARKSAVDPTMQIARLGQACQAAGRLEKIEMVSTIGVGGRMPGLVPERWLSEKREYHNTYEQAKAEAEVQLKKYVDQGLPVTIHRPSMVVGDSDRGRIIHFQIFYYICEFLSGRRTFGILPAIRHACLDIVPADYVARAIAWSSTSHDMSGRILHLCSGPGGALEIGVLGRQVRQTWRYLGMDLPPTITLPLPFFRLAAMLLQRVGPARMKRALSVLPVYYGYLAEKQSFANAATVEILEAAGIPLPEPSRYLEKVLHYYADNVEKNRG